MNPMLNLADAVATHARLTPNKIGTRDSRRELTYADWHDRACRLAANLLGKGLQPGDRVALLAYNCLEWMELYVGLAAAGLVAVPLNFRLTAPEVAYILNNAEASAIITGPGFCPLVDSVRDELAMQDDRFFVISDSPAPGWQAYESLMVPAGEAAETLEPVAPDSPCALMYTSGTTGRPKGAIRNHGGSTLIALATAVALGFTRDDTALLVMPLCHANSLYFGCTFIHLGATIVIDDSASFQPESLLAKLAENQVTFTSLVPTHFAMILALPQETLARYDVSRVGRLMISSAPAREPLKRAILEYFSNGRLYELYGSTEAGWVTLLTPDQQMKKLGSVGREWAGSGPIRLLDDQGNEVPDGEVGELFSRTAYVFDGYWKNPEKSAEAFNGLWCSVGDMARRDEDGFIWLVDRKSNMIISGGENIYPSEVEAVLGEHPSVADSAVVGMPDAKWGETVTAVVVLHQATADADAAELAEQLRQFCRERLAGFKCPRTVRFVQEQDLPRTATGKIQHKRLREALLAETQ